MIKVIHKALDILELISQNKDKPITLTVISQRTGEKPSTCSNILKTLLERGYVEKVGKKGYKLGIMAYGIANVSGYDIRLVERSRVCLKLLTEKIGAPSVLSVIRNEKKHVLLRIDSNSIIQVNSEKMDLSDLYETSTGLMLTAYLSNEELKSMIDKKGIPGFLKSREEFYEFLKNMRDDGHLVMTVKKEISEIAAPIIKDGKTIAAIGTYMPAYKFTSEAADFVLKAVINTTLEISNKL